MRVSAWIAVVLAILALPLLALGLINPLGWLVVLNWVWSLGVVVTAVGWVVWIARLIRRARGAAEPPLHSHG